MQIKLKVTCLLLMISVFSSKIIAQNSRIWFPVNSNQYDSNELLSRKSEPTQFKAFRLDVNQLRQDLLNAPMRNTPEGDNSNLIIEFPLSNGNKEKFVIVEAPVMDKALELKYPNFKSYSGKSIANPDTSIRFSVTNQGLHTMMFSSKYGTQYIDPYTKKGNIYIVYKKSELVNLGIPHKCFAKTTELTSLTNNIQQNVVNAQDGKMRKFRIAIATTIEYSSFHWMRAGIAAGATEAAKRTAVMDAIVVTLTRNSFIYERELSITFTLIPNNNTIVFINADNFSNNDANQLINQSQTQITNIIGSANFDIGHTFSTGGGGLAALGEVCQNSQKAAGITGNPAPVGDPYDVDFVAHEIGHQLGAPHTFNGTKGNCSGGNRVGPAAFEVGSGSTIMAYAGTCTTDNVQTNSDSYFHQQSINSIWTNVFSGFSTCANASAPLTGNSAPTANAGGNFTVPARTPYILEGNSTDADGTNTHTYTWEQFDLGPAGLPLETNTSGPMVRSFTGTTNKNRMVPRLQDLLNSPTSTKWEKLPSVTRTQKMRLTVRDNDTRGGQTASDDMDISFVDTGAPFKVTSQNTDNIVWMPGTTETISWNVAGTSTGTINTPLVDVYLSKDGGLTYDTLLIEDIPNTGSYNYVVPSGLVVGYARLMVRGSDNIFFNINEKVFKINAQIVTTCNTFSSGAVNTAIPDGVAANSPGPALLKNINVTDNETVSNVKLTVNINHTYSGDLTINLKKTSDSKSASAWKRTCSNLNFANITSTFQDGSPTVVCANPTSGTYAPAEAFSTFRGINSMGNWTLEITDSYNGDTGTLNSWSLDVCHESINALSTSEFDVNKFGVSIYPNPNNGQFNVNVNNTSANSINIDVLDIRGRKVYTNTFNTTNNQLSKSINLNNISKGMYIVSINDGTNTTNKKIIIE